jgi:hypothetical protein
VRDATLGWRGASVQGSVHRAGNPLRLGETAQMSCNAPQGGTQGGTKKFSLEGTIFRPLEEQSGSSREPCLESSSSRGMPAVECRCWSPRVFNVE